MAGRRETSRAQRAQKPVSWPFMRPALGQAPPLAAG